MRKKPRRTRGLKLFDIFVYPVLANIGVFVISVVATYLTNHGKEGWGKTGEWFYARGNNLKGFFMNKGMSEDQANMAKMVTFSFVDGSIMAPFIKLLEDRREKIAKWLDTKLGTKPEDESVYAAEPKQSWGSVLFGRLVTVILVVSTAVGLDQVTWNGKNLNDKFFNHPGIALGEKIQQKYPKLQKKLPNIDMKGVFGVSLFEGFYTSVCTFGLYVNSRLLAGLFEKRKENKRAAHAPSEQATEKTNVAAQENLPQEETPASPSPINFTEKYRSQESTVPPEAFLAGV